MQSLPFDLVTGLGFGAFLLLLLALPLAFWAVSSQARTGIVQLLVALANLLLALCFLLLGLSTFVFSYVVAHALRKRRERAEVAAFKQRFAPLMKEAPAEV